MQGLRTITPESPSANSSNRWTKKKKKKYLSAFLHYLLVYFGFTHVAESDYQKSRNVIPRDWIPFASSSILCEISHEDDKVSHAVLLIASDTGLCYNKRDKLRAEVKRRRCARYQNASVITPRRSTTVIVSKFSWKSPPNANSKRE